MTWVSLDYLNMTEEFRKFVFQQRFERLRIMDHQRVITLRLQQIFRISNRKIGPIGLNEEAKGGFSFTGNGLSLNL